MSDAPAETPAIGSPEWVIANMRANATAAYGFAQSPYSKSTPAVLDARKALYEYAHSDNPDPERYWQLRDVCFQMECRELDRRAAEAKAAAEPHN